MIEIIDGLWAAGETKTFHINGEYLEILDCQYTCDVYLMDKVGSQLSTMKGSEASFFSRPREGFQTVQIMSPQAQYLRVFVGSGDAGTRRISSTVQVIDGGRARTIAGAAFSGVHAVGGSAGNYGRIQLWNAPGSGKRLVVKAFALSVLNATSAVLGYITPAAASGVGMRLGVSKLSGGAAGTGSVRADVVATQTVLSLITSVTTVPGQAVFRQLQEPIVLTPGYGFTLESASANNQLDGAYEWTEEALT